jgi:hypothetical protein
MLRANCILLLSAIVLSASTSAAFPHVVQPGDTLASIAETIYGRIQYEKLLVAANGLDIGGGVPIRPGMRLEVPAVSYQRVKKGDTWAALAADLLGAPHRADVLAAENGSKPWLTPEEGAEILVPYNLRVVTTNSDTIVTLAYKFLGDKKKAWTLDHYNGLKGKALRDGDVILIPLSDLPLSDAGKSAARKAALALRTEAEAQKRASQLGVQNEIPALIADVRNGRYADAVTRGNKFLSAGDLSKPQLAIIHRHLLEAYVALGATGLATAACTEWRKNDERANLDEVSLSPKIIAACGRSK